MWARGVVLLCSVGVGAASIPAWCADISQTGVSVAVNGDGVDMGQDQPVRTGVGLVCMGPEWSFASDDTDDRS